MDNEEKLDAHGITKPLYDIYYLNTFMVTI